MEKEEDVQAQAQEAAQEDEVSTPEKIAAYFAVIFNYQEASFDKLRLRVSSAACIYGS